MIITTSTSYRTKMHHNWRPNAPPQAAVCEPHEPLVNHLWRPPNFTTKTITVQGPTFIPAKKSELKWIGRNWAWNVAVAGNFDRSILHRQATIWDGAVWCPRPKLTNALVSISTIWWIFIFKFRLVLLGALEVTFFFGKEFDLSFFTEVAECVKPSLST